ncbi:MAG: endonuclease/exonuclease/phosphatase family protein [Myxococcales bacterium]|nr:endonuclease/exonuclease/phosphatase family protein [Myxococcales bacterium]
MQKRAVDVIRRPWGAWVGGWILCLSLVWIAAPIRSSRAQTPRTTKIIPTRVAVQPLKLTRQRPKGTLRILTLNLAHGRKRSLHQYLLRKKTFMKNLQDVATVVRREQPDIAAFQEADAPSNWSGKFHHVDYLAEQAGYPYSVLGEHVKKMGLRYGTGFISRTPLANNISHIFKPSFPMPGKGFVIVTLTWPEIPSLKVDLISLHLDPLRNSMQRSQLQEIVEIVRTRKNPVIIMGDFNNEWFKESSPLRSFVRVLNLEAYQPFNPYLFTFPRFKKRFDWVFVPKGFRFVSYRVFKDALSDHYGIVTDIQAPKAYLAPTSAPAPRKVAPTPTSKPSTTPVSQPAPR